MVGRQWREGAGCQIVYATLDLPILPIPIYLLGARNECLSKLENNCFQTLRSKLDQLHEGKIW